jgi:hypothetical protein
MHPHTLGKLHASMKDPGRVSIKLIMINTLKRTVGQLEKSEQYEESSSGCDLMGFSCSRHLKTSNTFMGIYGLFYIPYESTRG